MSKKKEKAQKTISFVSKADTAELRAYQRQAALFPPLSHREILSLSEKFIEGRNALIALEEAELLMNICNNDLSDKTLTNKKEEVFAAYKTQISYMKDPIEPLTIISRIVSENGNNIDELYEKRCENLLPELFWQSPVSITSICPQCCDMTKAEFAAEQSNIILDVITYIEKHYSKTAPKDVIDIWKQRYNEIKKHYPSALKSLPITPTQQRKAHRKAEIGQQALDSIVNHNLQLAMSRVGKMMKTSQRAQQLEISDLIGAANIGLIMGARQFDPTKNRKFSTYAAFHIDGQLHDFINIEDGKSGIKGLSLHEQKQLNTLITIKTTFKKMFGREATLKELQSLSGISLNIISKRLTAPTIKTQSIHAPIGKDVDEDNVMLADIIESSENVDSALNKSEVDKIMQDILYEIDLLPSEQRKAIYIKTGLGDNFTTKPITSRKAAAAYGDGITVKEFNEIYNRGMNHLKNRLELRGWNTDCLMLFDETS